MKHFHDVTIMVDLDKKLEFLLAGEPPHDGLIDKDSIHHKHVLAHELHMCDGQVWTLHLLLPQNGIVQVAKTATLAS